MILIEGSNKIFMGHVRTEYLCFLDHCTFDASRKSAEEKGEENLISN